MWKLSKCVHIAGVGLVSRPEANVSAASRKLKSSWMNGNGTGMIGRIARRKSNAVIPQTTTAAPFRRAMPPRTFSSFANGLCPQRGQKIAVTTAITVKPASIRDRDAFGCNVDEAIIIGLERGEP